MKPPTQKQLGRRLVEIRKRKGLSQEDLAKRIGLSRSSLTQLELGNRNMDIITLQKIAYILGFSMDEFVSDESTTGNVVQDSGVQEYTTKTTERISRPVFSQLKFKNMLLYILERCAGKPNVGETVLYKLLYFSDFNYFERYEEHLSGATYRKLPFGPLPGQAEPTINQMLRDDLIQRIKTYYFDFPQIRYLPLVKADLRQLKASEKQIIDHVIDQMSDWSANAISDYSHKDMPWLASKEGEEINYELVFYREAPYTVRGYEAEGDDEF